MSTPDQNLDQPRLEVIEDGHVRTVALSGPPLTIGRAPDNRLVLASRYVSARHARVERAGAGHRILDAGSRNGLILAGRRVPAHDLADGDTISIGDAAGHFVSLTYRNPAAARVAPAESTALARPGRRTAPRLDVIGLSRSVAHGDLRQPLLRDIALSVAPREFVAIVGASGAGKSTLLQALSGASPADTGRVLVDGEDHTRGLAGHRSALGYVPQDDILHGGLPVARALTYTARLRLPPATPAAQIARSVVAALDEVEMAAYAATPVERLSGGQRKRVSIAAELLADPSLFLLDEPTSGLDPGLERRLMYTLRRLADRGRTVLLVTHATANIAVCDQVAFLAEGRLVYFGPPAEAAAFFNVAGGDFADIYTRLEGEAHPESPLVQRDLAAEYMAWAREAVGSAARPTLAELWERKYRASDQHRRFVDARLAQGRGPAASAQQVRPAQREPRGEHSGPLRQLGILTQRTLELMLRERRGLAILLLQAPVIALLLLLVAHPEALTGAHDAGLIPRGEARKLVFMLATVSVWLGIINAAREIVKERAILRRERLVGLRLGPYLASKLIVLGGLALTQSTILLGVLAARVGLPPDTGVLLPPALELALTMALTTLGGTALGLAISAASRSPDRALALVPLALIPQILFAGVIFAVEGAAAPLAWLTLSKWAVEALGASVDLNGLCNLPIGEGGVPVGCAPGLLQGEAAFAHTPAHLLGRWAALLLSAAAWIAAAAWLLGNTLGRRTPPSRRPTDPQR